MFAQYFNLPPFPFEVLLCVFEYLDRKDLPSVCVASKLLKSAATSVLYRNVPCGPVSADFNYSNSYTSSVDLTSWSSTHFTAVRHLDICGCWIQRRKPNPEHYKRLINVRSLNLAFPWHRCSNTYTTSLPMARYFLGSALQELTVESFEDMVGTRRTFLTVKKLRSKGPAALARLTEFDLPLLEDLDIGLVSVPADLDIVSTFTTLHTLTLEDGGSLFLSTALLFDMLSSLPHLHTFHYQSLRRCLWVEEITRPTNLLNLRDVSLYCQSQICEGQDEIALFLDLLAGTSQLERLRVKLLCEESVFYKGESLLSWVSRKHAQTISVLRLPHFYPPLASLQRLFRTPNLKKLAIGTNSTTLNQLDQLLATACVLEEFSMVLSSYRTAFRYEQAKALLNQCVDSKLHLIKVVIANDYDRRKLQCWKIAYKICWEYDSQIDQPLRYVEESKVYIRTVGFH